MRTLILGHDERAGLLHSYARAFAGFGEVETNCLARPFDENLIAAGSRVGRRVFYRRAVRAFNGQILEELRHRSADLVLVIKGEHFEAETVQALRARLGAPVVNFYPDDPFTRVFSNRLADPTSLAAYDACFTFAKHLIPSYERAGAVRVHYLPFAADPVLHQPVDAAAEPDFDVVFVGNLDAIRVAWLEPMTDLRVGVFGALTEAAVPRRSPLRRARFFPPVFAMDLAAALARGSVSLNVMRVQNRLSHNMRTYEAPACGAFTVSQRTPELEELFRDGHEVVLADDPADARAKVGRWLADPDGRMRVAEAGYRRVRDDTYAERAAAIVEALRAAGTLSASPIGAQGAAG